MRRSAKTETVTLTAETTLLIEREVPVTGTRRFGGEFIWQRALAAQSSDEAQNIAEPRARKVRNVVMDAGLPWQELLPPQVFRKRRDLWCHSEAQKIRESIWVILGTQHGERLMRSACWCQRKAPGLRASASRAAA